MLWRDFYDNFCDWSESTVRSRISSLEDIGPSCEVADAVLNLEGEELKAQLIRKAMKLGVELSRDDFLSLDGELPEALYEELARYGRFCTDTLYFDPDDFTWDDFYRECCDLPDEVLMKCIPRIDTFGPSDEVTEAVDSIVNFDIADALFTRAVQRGVRFTQGELERLGRSTDGSDRLFIADDVRDFNESVTDEMISEFDLAIDRVSVNVEKKVIGQRNPKPRRGGLVGILSAVAGAFAGDQKHSGRCDGDCASCPSHYGYRYGRWYYGHAHQYGCTFGGNGGRKGRTSRN